MAFKMVVSCNLLSLFRVKTKFCGEVDDKIIAVFTDDIRYMHFSEERE
jgi:hypothetical protein